MTDSDVDHLEEKAAEFRAVAKEHGAAGHDAIERTMLSAALELAAKAAKLRAERRFTSRRTADGDEMRKWSSN
jgi:hypothetical protein